MRIVTQTWSRAIRTVTCPAALLLVATPTLALDLDLGIASISIGTGAGLEVGVSALDGAATADVGLGAGGAGGASAPGGGAALAVIDVRAPGAGLNAGVAGEDALVGVAGTAAGIDITAGVLTADGLAELCVGACGAASPGSSSGTGPSDDGAREPPGIARLRPRCDNGGGNTSSFNGYTVIDRHGEPLGQVHTATIGRDLRLVTVRMQTTAGPGGGGACVQVGGVSGEIGSARQVQTTASAARIRQAVAAVRQ